MLSVLFVPLPYSSVTNFADYIISGEMKEFAAIVFAMLLGYSVIGQNDQVYQHLDEKMRPVLSQDEASYYSTLVASNDELVHIQVYFLDGQIRMKGSYTTETLEVPEGLFTYYYHSGAKESEGIYKDGFKAGKWKRWDWEGNMRPDRYYPMETPYDIVRKYSSEPAEFPGGYEGLAAYIGDNLSYPEAAWKNKIEGEVNVAFLIDAGGVVRNIEVIESSHPILNDEALRIVMQMPVWKPARKAGQPVASKFILPLQFILSDYRPIDQ
ncbi:MAG: TonB family protein [Flavobacteriales bacterium]|nr:TonB family protein [Flavobacteriales bacterium]